MLHDKFVKSEGLVEGILPVRLIERLGDGVVLSAKLAGLPSQEDERNDASNDTDNFGKCLCRVEPTITGL
ncbi:hypothetical protein [Phytohabitans rumicis]|uniref:Uncharacterized protein n=1 Tax=Phytohabitans rumicis TaxID=1076125 RepID=A0A6V8LR66_9ACTN|nr:hypothetical protein [Phytohabitans rumicis]GFJ95225.1 hypothetical protein Prum_088670 [Phytohabitans rumicis]